MGEADGRLTRLPFSHKAPAEATVRTEPQGFSRLCFKTCWLFDPQKFGFSPKNAATMFSNRNGSSKGFMSSFRRKSSGGTSSPEASPGRQSSSPGKKSSMKKQGTWVANGMPAPAKSVVQEVEQKRAEDNSAVKVQSIIRGKSARTEADGKKKQKKEESEAASSLQSLPHLGPEPNQPSNLTPTP